jgi:hypothetical protein
LTALSRTGWVAVGTPAGGTNVAANAIDASLTTRWGTGTNQVATGQSFQVDMLEARTFNEITMNSAATANNYPRGYQVFVSNDGTTWGSAIATGAGTSDIVSVIFPVQTARYIKVNQTGTAGNWWSIYDFNVLNTSLPRAGWVATASSSSGTDLPAKALDDTATTRWNAASLQANGQFFQVDMVIPQTFNQVTLDAGTSTGNYPRGYQIVVSTNGTTWSSPVATGTPTAQFVVATFPTQQARYLKIIQTGTSASNSWSIHELNVYGQPTVPTAQPRVGWVATASSNSSGNTPPNALDGSTTSRWSSAGAQTGQWFQVDMLASRAFTQLILDAGTTTGNYPRGYKIEVSSDASTWTTVTTGTGTTALITVDFPLQTARHIKISQTATSTSTWSIQELTVTGPALSRPGWVAVASSTGGTDLAMKALDGTASTRWSTAVAQANGQSFQIDMVTPQVFNQVTLDAGTSTGNYPRGYQLQVSSDGATWSSSVATGTGTSQLVTINFTTQTARYVKIVQTGTATNVWSIHELNVWRVAQQLCDQVTCTASDQCHTAGTCDQATGLCSNPVKANGTSCNDSSACTTGDSCQDGTCTGSAVTCTTDACHTIGACVPATGCPAPVNKANGTACNDSSACTTGDSCQNGTCTGTAVTCTTDACHTIGACVPATGCPALVNKANGTSCSDNNACTTGETCQSGVCSGGTTVTCTATACRNAGTCSPATGCSVGSNKANGTTCNDSSACTTGDSCQNGTCTGTAVTCTTDACHTIGACVPATGCPAAVNRPNGTTCNDNNACTTGEACQSGVCSGGTAVTCTASACRNAGTCNPTTGCAATNKPNGTTCTDNNACTTGDSCQAGVCSGAAITCTVSNTCLTPGTCVPATGCPAPTPKAEGASCNDSNACTSGDTCRSGTCQGTALTCVAADGCHVAGTCNRYSGTCSNPLLASEPLCATAPPPPGLEFYEPMNGQPTNRAIDVNNRGQVLGVSDPGFQPWFGPTSWAAFGGGSTAVPPYPFLTVNDSPISLPLVSGSIIVPSAVNDASDVAAGLFNVATRVPAPVGVIPGDGSAAINLVPFSQASAITDMNDVTGPGGATMVGATIGPSGRLEAFSRRNNQTTLLPALSGGLDGGALSVNDQNDIVGAYRISGADELSRVAVAWLGGAAINLNDIQVPALPYPNGGWYLTMATAINNERQVVGVGFDPAQFGRAFLMDLDTGEVVTLGTLGPPWDSLYPTAPIPHAINSQGHVVGAVGSFFAETAGYTLDPLFGVCPWYSYGHRAFVYTRALGMVDLNTLVTLPAGWVLEDATAINDRDEVVGFATYTDGTRRAYKFAIAEAIGEPTTCAGKPDGSICEDGDPCTLADVCQSGACRHGTIKTCAAPDQCHTATCDSSTGQCKSFELPEGASCSDGNACTVADACAQGVCQPGNPTTCFATDSCHLVGTCNTSTGVCSNPVSTVPNCAANQPPALPKLTSQTSGTIPRDGILLDPATGVLTVAAATPGGGAAAPVATVTVPAMVGSSVTCAADFNNDATTDVLFVNNTARTLKFLPRTDTLLATYDQAQIKVVDAAAPVGTAGGIDCDDVDGDGDVDVVVAFNNAPSAPTLAVYFNQNSGASFDRRLMTHGLPSTAVLSSHALADFTNDGRPDLAVYAANDQTVLDSQIFVFTNSGSSTQPFSSSARASVPQTGMIATLDAAAPKWGALTTIDWDGDGRRDIWAVGNRGLVTLFRTNGAATFDPPELDGYIANLPAQFDIRHIDTDGDKIPDLIFGARPAPPSPFPIPRIYRGAGGGILINFPNSTSTTTTNSIGSLRSFRPFIPQGATGASAPVGLLKGQPVAMTYYDDRDVPHPSVLVQTVDGHLAERVEYVNVRKVLQSGTFGTLTGLKSGIGTKLCNAIHCDSGTSVTTAQQPVEIRTTVLNWLDHGTPPGTIVDSQPEVVMVDVGGKIQRQIFVRGLDGHLWELRQANGGETWIDHKLPPTTNGNGIPHQPNPEPTALAQVPLVAAPSAVAYTENFVQNTKVFVLDAAGRMDTLTTHAWGGTTAWTSEGLIGKGNCYGAVGHLGNGSPKAITWKWTGGARHVQAFVTSAEGDLFSWKDGVWMESLSSYGLIGDNNGGASACPNAHDFRYLVNRRPTYGTPDAFIWNQTNGSAFTAIFATGAQSWQTSGPLPAYGPRGVFGIYITDTDSTPTPASWTNPPPTAPKGPRGVPPLVVEQFETPYCRPEKILAVSEPRVTLDDAGQPHVLVRSDQAFLNIAHRRADVNNPGWDWEIKRFDPALPENSDDQVPSFRSITPRLVQTPTAIARPTPAGGAARVLDLYAVQSDGLLHSGTDTSPVNNAAWHICTSLCPGADAQCSPSTPQGAIAWDPNNRHEPPLVPRLHNSHKSATVNGCSDDLVIDKIFPQWVSAPRFDPATQKWDEKGQRGIIPEVLYDEDDDMEFGGYESEVMQEIQGVVVATHMSAVDNPANHTLDPYVGATPRVHHDWNVIVAPDQQYQGLLADANILEGGTMELEWEMDSMSFSEDAIPSIGDRIAARGRFIFDCGHPPAHTEIHPINALAIIHGDTGGLRFSKNGGPTWWQPNDRNLSFPVPRSAGGTKCELLTGFQSNLGGWDIVRLVVGNSDLDCQRRIGLEMFTQGTGPTPPGCYGSYLHSMRDILNPVSGGIPLVFDVPVINPGAGLPTPVLTIGRPGEPFFQSISSVQQAPTPHFSVSIPPGAMPPDVPTTSCYGVQGNGGSAKRHFQVCYQATFDDANHPHDNFDQPWFAKPLCQQDHTDEHVLYVTVNDRTRRYGGESDNCIVTSVRPEDTLRIDANGFECDLSCGEIPEVNSFGQLFDFEYADDRLGRVQAAFTADRNFGAGGSYNFVSQPSMATDRAKLISAEDYQLWVSITELSGRDDACVP